MTVRASDNGTVRNDDPSPNDYALVVRPIGGGAGGDVEAIAQPTTGALSAVPGSLASVELLAANPDRAGFSIRNTSEIATLYVLANTAGGNASPTNHTVAIAAGGYYEDPYNYVGVVAGAWAASFDPADLALVTEYVPV